MSQGVSEKGFTLIEVLVAMALAGIIMAVVFTAYQVQVKGKNIQEETTDMNQAVRVAMQIMEREIRMAGCDPTGGAGAGFQTMNPAEIAFTMDITGAASGASDGDSADANESIRYALTNDADGNGIANGTPCDLGRDTGNGGGLQTIAKNVDAVNFLYLDAEGNVLPTPVNPNAIRSIQVTIVARSGENLRGMMGANTDTRIYTNLQPKLDAAGNANPDYWEFDPDDDLSANAAKLRRVQLTQIIHCRNIGI